MKSNTNNRVEYIDALRGMTMILVVYSHIANLGLVNVNMAYNNVFMTFRMPTFFFISGWVFYKADRIWNKDTIWSIIKKKFMVQIIPFLIFLLLYMYLFFNVPGHCNSFEDKYGYWFTLSLFEYFIIYIAVEALFNKQHTNRKEIIVMSIMFALSIIAFYYGQVKFVVNIGIWRPILTFLSFTKIKYIIFFWFGTFVKKNFDKFIRITDNQYMIAVCLCLFLFTIIGPFDYNNIEFQFITYLFAGLTGIIIVFTFFRRNESLFSKNTRIGFVLQYVGQRTLDIYLLHYLFLPNHMTQIGTWLSQYSNKSIDMLIILVISLWITAITLIISNIIRLSPFLGHYLFGVKRTPLKVKSESKL